MSYSFPRIFTVALWKTVHRLPITRTKLWQAASRMWLIDQIMWKSFDKRLASFLLDEANIEGMNVLKITHEEIGNHLGNPREVVTRMLKYFVSEGAVKLSRGTIEIVDESKLANITEG